MDLAWMAASMGGLDGIVFTGGIGEHDAEVRGSICARLGWFGVDVDPAATAAGRISRLGSAIEVWVIPTDEEAVIAREACNLSRN